MSDSLPASSGDDGGSILLFLLLYADSVGRSLLSRNGYYTPTATVSLRSDTSMILLATML